MRLVRAGPWLLLLLSLCGCRSVLREVTFRPDVDDRSGLSEAFLSDRGVLLICGAVTDVEFMREARARGDERTLVQRSYTLSLTLGEAAGLAGTLEQIEIDSHPSLTVRRGSGACDFEHKRAALFPDETGWTRIGMAWVGNDRVSETAIRSGELPRPKEGQRATLYMVDRSMGPVYLFVGQATTTSPFRELLLRLGMEHVKALWPSSTTKRPRQLQLTHWGLYAPTTTIARQQTEDGSVAVVDPYAVPVLRQQADELEVQLGDRIGIQYQALGIPARATYPVEIQVHHPPIDGQRVSRWKAAAQGGVELYTGWHFQHPCQLLPGVWRFEVHHEGHVLVAKDLMITVAPGQPSAVDCHHAGN